MLEVEIGMIQDKIDDMILEREETMERTKELKSQISKLESVKKRLIEVYA